MPSRWRARCRCRPRRAWRSSARARKRRRWCTVPRASPVPPGVHHVRPARHARQRQQHDPQAAAATDRGPGQQILIVAGVDVHRVQRAGVGDPARTACDLRLQATAAEPPHLRIAGTEQRHRTGPHVGRTFGRHDHGQRAPFAGGGGREQYGRGRRHGTTMAQPARRRQRLARRPGHRATMPEDHASTGPCFHWHPTGPRSIVVGSHAAARRRHEVERQRGRARSRRAG